MATIGTVTYPTEDTWEVEVSGLESGVPVILLVSDGSETLEQEVEVIPGFVLIDALPASFALTALSPTISFSLADRFKFPGPLKIWNGSTFVDGPFKSFDGSTLN
jgi:hypothetical protein